MKSVTQRLEAAEAILRRNEPERLFVQLIDGTVETTDALGVWEHFKDETKRKRVTDVWTESPGFEELAGVIKILCTS